MHKTLPYSEEKGVKSIYNYLTSVFPLTHKKGMFACFQTALNFLEMLPLTVVRCFV